MGWLYQHDGKTHGPISRDEMKDLADKGQLDRHDLVWEEEADQAQAKPASALVDFPGTIPDWLPDIAALETKKPSAQSASAAEVPEWLEDMRLWVSLELHAKTSDAQLAKQTLQETGFDVTSGRILDRDKFNEWKEQKAPPTEASQHFLTNQSQFEVFRKARTAIETWVDDPDNRAAILLADIKEIIRSAGIQAVFRDFAGFGFRQKLEKHLAILVEKRKKRAGEPGP